MKVLVPAESRPGENRVALVPESVGRLTALGLTVAVQTGAGLRSYATDDDYRQAGAEVIATEHVAAALGVTDVVATVRPLHPKAVELLKPGAVSLSFLQPVADLATVVAAANAGATALSFDLVPRISRAQSMDALTSQSLVSGYLAALVGATRLPKFFPLFMTAAGTIPPAKVLVLGAGVAGLQAMATARRLGAVVSGYDVRPASADEVKSMGATFLALDLETAQGAGGYATEMSDDRAARQMELLAPYVADSDVVITTAAIPGRPAPRLVSAEMVAAMRSGSVVVDLAAESGGNVEGSQPGAEVQIGGALVWGGADVPSQMPVHASKLYSANVVALLTLITTDGIVDADLADEVIDGCAVVHRGTVRNAAAAQALGLEVAPAAPREDEPATPPEPAERREPEEPSRPQPPDAGRSRASRPGAPPHRRRSPDGGHGTAHDLRPEHLRRLRGHRQGVLGAAHPVDVRRQRHPRHRADRRDHRGRIRGQQQPVLAGHRGRRARLDEPGRWLRRHRPDARDVRRTEEEVAVTDKEAGQ